MVHLSNTSALIVETGGGFRNITARADRDLQWAIRDDRDGRWGSRERCGPFNGGTLLLQCPLH